MALQSSLTNSGRCPRRPARRDPGPGRASRDGGAQAGHGADEILVAGGATRSPLWLQMHADVTGLPVAPPLPQVALQTCERCQTLQPCRRRVAVPPAKPPPPHQRGRGRAWEDRSPSARVQTARSSVRAQPRPPPRARRGDQTCPVSTGGRNETCPVSTGGRGGAHAPRG